jgi:hypothetical protein
MFLFMKLQNLKADRECVNFKDGYGTYSETLLIAFMCSLFNDALSDLHFSALSKSWSLTTVDIEAGYSPWLR